MASEMTNTKTILFICTGNVCRSPMAEGLFRDALGEHKDTFTILSAGMDAMDGLPPSLNAVEATKEVGVDITRQKSSQITREMVDQADYIFGMTWNHVMAITHFFPEAAPKTFLVRHFDTNVGPDKKEIADPIGGPLEVYRLCRDQINQGIHSIIKELDKTISMQDAPKNSVAIGSDHAGFDLKESIKTQLLGLGLDVLDLGTHSKDSTDYPEYSDLVTRQIRDKNASKGILVCSSGVGMSIAANKKPGIRAALAQSKEVAELCRKHNDANVLCLGQNFVDPKVASEIVETFLNTEFEGERHERRVNKLSDSVVSSKDAEIASHMEKERLRQQNHIELIASENFTSPAVMAVQGSVLTNKYAEGYPGKRWYGGCEFIDDMETLAIERAKELFGAEHANVQPHSGSSANMAVYFAFLKPGDKILTMDLSHGGHLTHGNAANFSGIFYDVVHYGVRESDERIDYDQLAEMAAEHKPKMITVGASAYSREINFERMGEIAKEVGALLLADIAHIAGLVASGEHPSPVNHADFVTTTTHKTLRGPRGGLILCREQYGKAIDSKVFPGIQGGPLEHVIAAKALCFREAMQPEFKEYQIQVKKNASALAEGMSRNGFRIVSGGTDNHLILVDVNQKGLTGKQCQHALDQAGITLNKNTIPFETLSPFKASGVRIGSPAVTTRGMKEPEMMAIADMISEVLGDIENAEVQSGVLKRVHELTSIFPLPY